jgi:hypothetical protein
MNMDFKVIDKLMIVAHGTGDPTDIEWQRYVKQVQSNGNSGMRHLIYTDGGAPTVEQYRALTAAFDGLVVPTAVISDGLLLRARLAAVSWFNSSIKPFPPTGLPDALQFLQVPPSQYTLVTRELQALRRAVAEGYDR